jgi:glyoxylate/hydroxypyruvate reductase
MTTQTTSDLHIHFETRSTKPPIFKMTEAGIASARSRSIVPEVRTSLGHDLKDLAWLEHAVGLVTSNDLIRDPKFPLRELASAAPRLRWVHVIAAGIEPLLPLDWLPKHVILTNNSGVHFEKTRESATMALLMLNARVPTIATNQRAARWDQIFSPLIAGKVALVIGLGDMGAAVAKAAKQLGIRVIGVRRTHLTPHPDVDEMVSIDTLDVVLPKADFVALATPLTPETRNLLDRGRIGLMKRGAGFLNIGRAACVDHAALVVALASGALSGAVLDVYDSEPLPASSPLWRTDHLLLIPHVTSDDPEHYLPKTFDLVFANVARLLRGESLLNVVDPERGY